MDGLASQATGRDGLGVDVLSASGKTNRHLILPLRETASLVRLSRRSSEEYAASFSPDGRWISYMSSESGKPERTVPFQPGGKWQISTGGALGGGWWGKEAGDHLRPPTSTSSVEVMVGARLEIGPPRVLFNSPGWAIGTFGRTAIAF
jgi:hypothetical protein